MRELSPAARARYFRRQTIDRVMGGLCVVAAGIGLILLGLILWMLFSNGIGGLSLSVFTNPMAQPGAAGGLANAIVGSLIQVGLGAMIGAPIGMMVGVYLSEVGKESRFASVVRFVNDILLSAPSVLIGLFVYQIAVSPFGGFSGFAVVERGLNPRPASTSFRRPRASSTWSSTWSSPSTWTAAAATPRP